MISKPQMVLFSKYRHKCLGLEYARFHAMQNIVYACLAWVVSQSTKREDGIYHLSNLTDHAWDKTNPADTGEVLALGVMCGSLYDRMGEYGVATSVKLTIANVHLEVGKTPGFEEFYAEAMKQIEAEDNEPANAEYLAQAEKEYVEEVITPHY